jgi:uncharacterized protein
MIFFCSRIFNNLFQPFLMLNNTGLCICISLYFFFSSFAQQPEAKDNNKKVFELPSPSALLWKISGNGILKPSYIFGTMHILCEDDAKLSDSLKNVIANCDEIYFEIDITDMTGMLSAIKYMRMNDDKKLSDLLSNEDYIKVKNYFGKHSSILPFSILEHFKPMLISSLIEEDDLPCKTTNGMELVIMKKAKDENKKINGLEDAAFQASLFDSIPYINQAKDLVKYIDSSAEFKKMTVTLAKLIKHRT